MAKKKSTASSSAGSFTSDSQGKISNAKGKWGQVKKMAKKVQEKAKVLGYNELKDLAREYNAKLPKGSKKRINLRQSGEKISAALGIKPAQEKKPEKASKLQPTEKKPPAKPGEAWGKTLDKVERGEAKPKLSGEAKGDFRKQVQEAAKKLTADKPKVEVEKPAPKETIDGLVKAVEAKKKEIKSKDGKDKSTPEGYTRTELYNLAKDAKVPGYSKMNKQQLFDSLGIGKKEEARKPEPVTEKKSEPKKEPVVEVKKSEPKKEEIKKPEPVAEVKKPESATEAKKSEPKKEETKKPDSSVKIEKPKVESETKKIDPQKQDTEKSRSLSEAKEAIPTKVEDLSPEAQDVAKLGYRERDNFLRTQTDYSETRSGTTRIDQLIDMVKDDDKDQFDFSDATAQSHLRGLGIEATKPGTKAYQEAGSFAALKVYSETSENLKDEMAMKMFDNGFGVKDFKTDTKSQALNQINLDLLSRVERLIKEGKVRDLTKPQQQVKQEKVADKENINSDDNGLDDF